MANIENLKPFKPGNDDRRNLKWAPKKIPALDTLLAEVLGNTNNEGIEIARAILLALIAKALKGDTKAIEIILDRAYGKPGLSIDHGIKGMEKMGIQIIIDSDDAKLGE
jgi:hypothetical protein